VFLGSVIYHGDTSTQRDVRCTQDAQGRAGDSCDRMTTEQIHDDYCDLLLADRTSTGRPGTAAREYALRYSGQRHPGANEFPLLEQRLI
jgi:hypothetical protein